MKYIILVISDETMAVHRIEVDDLEKRVASWPVPALANARGRWLGEIPAYLHFDNIAKIIDPHGSERFVRVPYIGRDGRPLTDVRLRDMVDALLYLGPQQKLIFTPPESRSGHT